MNGYLFGIVASAVTALAALTLAVAQVIALRRQRYLEADLGRTLAVNDKDRATFQEIILTQIAAGKTSSADSTSRDDGIQISQSRIFAELAHTLRTPLSAIRHQADAIALSNSDQPEIAEQTSKVLGFTDLCDNILATFRQLIDTEKRAENLKSGPLEDMINELYEMLAGELRSTSPLLLQYIPKTLQGYSSGYLITLLLPLIENAIEASPRGEPVTVAYRATRDRHIFEIVNSLESAHNKPVFPTDGSSSKHDGPGLGLEIARRLAGMRRGGRIEILEESDLAIVRVMLRRSVS